MKKLVIFFGMNVGGALGWWLGGLQSITLAVVLCAVGSGLGAWYTRKLAEDYLE
jgi:uncharacterized membrane protein YfcA